MLVDHRLQFLARVEGHHAPCRDRNLFPGLWVTPWALRFIAQLEIAETGQLDAFTGLQGNAHFLEEALHHVLGFALVQSDFFEQEIGQIGLRQRHLMASVAQFAIELNTQSLDQVGNGQIDFLVGQSFLSILQ